MTADQRDHQCVLGDEGVIVPEAPPKKARKKAQPSKPRTWVKMFMPEFAEKVRTGGKRQTVRPIPERIEDRPRLGDRISCRMWEGKPYDSKQLILREGTIIGLGTVEIREQFVSVSDEMVDCDPFALRDGFRSYRHMVKWFTENHGLPFRGMVIIWSNE